MDVTTLKHFEKILLNDRAEIMEDLALTNESFSGFDKVHTGDLVDQATKFYEKELVISLTRTEKETLDAIDKAILRIKEKTFGLCEACNKEIDSKRLEAIPYATLCIDCKKSAPKKAAPKPIPREDFSL